MYNPPLPPPTVSVHLQPCPILPSNTNMSCQSMLSPSTPLLPVRARRLRQARLSKRKQVACVYKKPGEQRKSDSRHSEAAGDRRDTGEKSHKELRRYSIFHYKPNIFPVYIIFPGTSLAGSCRSQHMLYRYLVSEGGSGAGGGNRLCHMTRLATCDRGPGE